MDFDAQTDVLVVGCGACGLAAAIAARDAGAGEVALIEKLDRPGGNTALSTGSVPGAGSRFQREAKIADSPERMIEDLMRKAGAHDVPELTRLLAFESADLCEWLVDTVKARMKLITDYCHVGHSVPRLHAPASRRGIDLFTDLMQAAEARDVTVAVGIPALRLIADDDGAVVGAILGDGRGGETRMRAGKVVLATNGYAGNKDVLRRFCPDIAAADYYGALGSTGEAVLFGEAVGAALANMAAYQGYAAVAYPHGSLLSWTTIEKGGILVGADARRFGDESAGYSGYAQVVRGQGEFAWAVFDERICKVAQLEEEFQELINHGGVKRADSAEALAAMHGLDGAALRATIDAYNAAARGQARDPFGRTDFQLAPLTAPFFICKAKAGLFHTQGGLKVDAGARVLRPDGRAVPNLFAGGGAAAGISGRAGGGGYASGNGLLTALGLGRIAGRMAAAELAGRG